MRPASLSLDGQRAAAAQASADGMTAMKDADADPHRAVDAAIAFSRALAIDNALGDADAVCEMQADIFWCKKRMNLQDLQDYLAHKDAKSRDEFTAAQAVMDKAVPIDEAAAYLDRADKYRAANAQLHFQVAIRYSEVVERFAGTAQASTAAAVFAHEQSAYLAEVSQERAAEHAQLEREIAHARETRFTTPPAVVAGRRIAAPARADHDAALATVKSLYRAEYVRARRDTEKRALARRLAVDAEKSRDNAPGYQVMLEESIRFAEEVEDYGLLLEDCDRLAAAFAGPDAKTISAGRAGHAHDPAAPPPRPSSPCSTTRATRRPTPLSGKYFCYGLPGAGTKDWPMLADRRMTLRPESPRPRTWRTPSPRAPRNSAWWATPGMEARRRRHGESDKHGRLDARPALVPAVRRQPGRHQPGRGPAPARRFRAHPAAGHHRLEPPHRQPVAAHQGPRGERGRSFRPLRQRVHPRWRRDPRGPLPGRHLDLEHPGP